MNCWHCKSKLVWGGDHDCDEDSEFLIVSNFTCPKCNSYVEVFYPKDDEDNE